MIRKHLALLMFTALLAGYLPAQEEVKMSADTTAEPEYLIGKVDRQDLQKGDFGRYFEKEYNSYEPDPSVLDILENSGLFQNRITIVLATWCHDSKLQVPRFLKVLDLLNYNTRTIQYFSVDKQKSCGDLDISEYRIERVPTFILYENDLEVGRIIESPFRSLEKDLLQILND